MANNRNIFDLMLESAEPSSTKTIFNEPSFSAKPPAEIRQDPRNWIQRKADELYADPDVGGVAAAVADVLPGIPFVDIIDPPDRLVDEGQQNIRNIVALSELAMGLKALPKTAGRVFTNVKTPVAYGISRNLKKEGYNPIKAIKSITKDEPYWDPQMMSGAQVTKDITNQGLLAARDKPYREMFGLKQREWSKDIYKEISPGVIEYNKKNPIGNKLRENVIGNIIDYHKGTKTHLTKSGNNIIGAKDFVMGGFNLKYDPKTKDWIYEDKWDFGINKGELKNLFKELQENGLTTDIGFKFKKALTMGLRKGVDMITDPVTIRGRIPDSEVKAMWDMNKQEELAEKIGYYSPSISKGVGIPAINTKNLSKFIDEYPGGI